MLSKRTVILLTLAATWTVSLQPAHAESGLLVVGGRAAEHERAVVGGAIENAIRKAGWSLPTKPLTKNETDGLLNCSDSNAPWNCVPASFGDKGVRGVFVVTVESSQADNGAPLVIITEQMIVTNPPASTVHQRFCEHCGDDKLGAAGEELTQQLARELAARTGPTPVRINSVPADAEVILDCVRIGATDSTFKMSQEPHVVTVQKPGFLSESRAFTAGPDKTTEVTFTLHPSGPPQPPAPPEPPSGSPRAPSSGSSNLVPGIALGTGVSLVVFAGISVYRGQLNSPNDKYIYTRATAVGVASGLVGLGAIGAGLYLLWRDPPQSSAPTSAPTASVTSGGAIVGWAGRF